jgi:folylpolyglutamate synthase/dihydropteroate synthase
VEDPRHGLRRLLENAGPDDVVLVAGSLYLLGEVRPMALEFAAPARRDQAKDSLRTQRR